MTLYHACACCDYSARSSYSGCAGVHIVRRGHAASRQVQECVHLDQGGAVTPLHVFCNVGGGICHTMEAHAMHVVCFDVGDLMAELMALLWFDVGTCLLHSCVYGMYLCARALLRAFSDAAHHFAHGVVMPRYPGSGQVAGEAHDAAL